MGIDLLDQVLLFLYKNRGYHQIHEIYSGVPYHYHERIIDILVVLEKLARDGYITIEDQTIRVPKTGETRTERAYFISFEGIVFFEKSPFIWKNRPHKWNKITGMTKTAWRIAKTIAILANAVIISLIAFWTLEAQRSANKVKNVPSPQDTIYIKRDTIYSASPHF